MHPASDRLRTVRGWAFLRRVCQSVLSEPELCIDIAESHDSNLDKLRKEHVVYAGYAY